MIGAQSGYIALLSDDGQENETVPTSLILKNFLWGAEKRAVGGRSSGIETIQHKGVE